MPAAPPSFANDCEEEDDFHWDAAAEAELQAIEAAYAATKRRRLPDWPTPSSVRACPNPVAASRGSPAPSWIPSTPAFRGNVKAMYQPVVFRGKIVYCRTPSEVEKATRDILRKIETMKASGQVSLGFDLEWRPFPRRGVPPALKSLLEDSSTVKVGICIDNDARKMFNDYDVHVQPLMDLSNLANAKLGVPPKRWSLASLTEMVTCKELPKPSNIRMGNWEAYALSKQQLQYAATDAYISWHLYEVLQSLPDNNVEVEKETVTST
uniref:3'-5' exonuclease n=1 Tax=Leersia perrieri TaxID=77586 RepID=A0A0D9W1Y2_9ORYZ